MADAPSPASALARIREEFARAVGADTTPAAPLSPALDALAAATHGGEHPGIHALLELIHSYRTQLAALLAHRLAGLAPPPDGQGQPWLPLAHQAIDAVHGCPDCKVRFVLVDTAHAPLVAASEHQTMHALLDVMLNAAQVTPRGEVVLRCERAGAMLQLSAGIPPQCFVQQLPLAA